MTMMIRKKGRNNTAQQLYAKKEEKNATHLCPAYLSVLIFHQPCMLLLLAIDMLYRNYCAFKGMKFIIQTICHFFLLFLSIMDVRQCLWPIHDSSSYYSGFLFCLFFFVFSPFIHFFFFFFLILACRSTAQLFACHFLNQLILRLGCWKTGATTTKTGRRKSNENVWNPFPKEKKRKF